MPDAERTVLTNTGGVVASWADGQQLTDAQIEDCLARGLDLIDATGRVAVLIPDSTRTIDLARLLPPVLDHLRTRTTAIEVIVALGTHQPMTESRIGEMIGVAPSVWSERFPGVCIRNHEWHRPDRLVSVGVIPADEIADLSGGRISRTVDVTIDRTVADADLVLVLGPVFPHEVVGFSGGNKYLFPGVSGPDTIAVTHWLGALIGSHSIIGQLGPTPVRRLIDRAAGLVNGRRMCAAVVCAADGATLGLSVGSCEDAWAAAAEWSARTHIRLENEPYHEVLAIVPPMYPDLWTGAKAMYKLDPIVADGGRITLLAPHIADFSVTHGRVLERIGYHCSEYFVQQWDRFGHEPWGVLAHSTHLRGRGTFTASHGERCRIDVSIASRISRSRCEQVGLHWMDPTTLDPTTFADTGRRRLVVPRAGEQLFRLRQQIEG